MRLADDIAAGYGYAYGHGRRAKRGKSSTNITVGYGNRRIIAGICKNELCMPRLCANFAGILQETKTMDAKTMQEALNTLYWDINEKDVATENKD
jgi:hypothetical protein